MRRPESEDGAQEKHAYEEMFTLEDVLQSLQEPYLTQWEQSNQPDLSAEDYRVATAYAYGDFADQQIAGALIRVPQPNNQPALWKFVDPPQDPHFEEGLPQPVILAQWIHDYMIQERMSWEEAEESAMNGFSQRRRERKIIARKSTNPAYDVLYAPALLSRRTMMIGAASATVITIAGSGIVWHALTHQDNERPIQTVPTATRPPTHATPTPIELTGIAYRGRPRLETNVADSEHFDLYSLQLALPRNYGMSLALLHDPLDPAHQHIQSLAGWFHTPGGADYYREVFQAIQTPLDSDRYNKLYDTPRLIWKFTDTTIPRYALVLLRVPKGHALTANGKSQFDLRAIPMGEIQKVEEALPTHYPELVGVKPSVFTDVKSADINPNDPSSVGPL